MGPRSKKGREFSSSWAGVEMVNCSDFLREYSDYRDGLIAPERRGELDAHMAGCSACSRYDHVVTTGIGELRALPAVDPSDDFLPRLQHKIFHLQEETSWWSRSDTSGTSAGFVLLLVVLIGAAAWIPTVGSQPPLIELPPVVAIAPTPAEEVHTLFREGPLLAPARSLSPAYARTGSTVFFRYTRLGSNTSYQVSTSAPR